MANGPLKLLAVAVVAILVVVAAAYGLFAFILVSSDHATYWSNGTNYQDVDYDSVLGNAQDAGYRVDGPYYVNAKQIDGYRPDVPALDERFGDDYVVQFVTLYYSETKYIEVSPAGDGSRVAFFDDTRDFEQPYTVRNLPPDDWLVDRFTLVFDMDGATAQRYVDDLKADIGEGESDIPMLQVSESVTFARAYDQFQSESTNVSVRLPQGEGTLVEAYSTDGQDTATVAFVVPNSEIVMERGDARYIVKVDRLGGMHLEIRLPAGEELAEDEYRSAFRELFDDLGIPPERADDFEFDYSPGNW
ncbi:hypothetical protein ACFQH6_18880 [Halobacteriaceae archaeon GCM10025711]